MMILGYWYYCVSYNLGVTLVRSPANTHVIYLAAAQRGRFWRVFGGQGVGQFLHSNWGDSARYLEDSAPNLDRKGVG